MPHAYQLIDQPRHDPLGAAIELGRDTFSQRRYLGNSHWLSTITSQGLSNPRVRPSAVHIWPAGRANPPTAGSSESSAAHFLSPASRSAAVVRDPSHSRSWARRTRLRRAFRGVSHFDW